MSNEVTQRDPRRSLPVDDACHGRVCIFSSRVGALDNSGVANGSLRDSKRDYVSLGESQRGSSHIRGQRSALKVGFASGVAMALVFATLFSANPELP